MCSIQSCLKPGHFLYIYEDGILGTKVCIPSDLFLGLILFPFIQNFLRVVMQGLNSLQQCWADTGLKGLMHLFNLSCVAFYGGFLLVFGFLLLAYFVFQKLLRGRINSWGVCQVTSQPDWRKKNVGPSLYLDHSWFPSFSSLLELFSFTVSAVLYDTRIDFAGFDHRKGCRP